MIVINQWPMSTDLPLPPAVVDDVVKQLTAPFESQDHARQYWEDMDCYLFIIEEGDCLEGIDQESQQRISFTLEFWEFIEVIADDYRLLLSINGDDGSGTYLLLSTTNPLWERLSDA